jgi:hypothetical protein
MKRIKNPMAGLERELRKRWSWSSQRKGVIKAITFISDDGHKVFNCPKCTRSWPVEFATVHHVPSLGGLQSESQIQDYYMRLFHGPQFAICVHCHRAETKRERKEEALERKAAKAAQGGRHESL